MDATPSVQSILPHKHTPDSLIYAVILYQLFMLTDAPTLQKSWDFVMPDVFRMSFQYLI